MFVGCLLFCWFFPRARSWANPSPGACFVVFVGVCCFVVFVFVGCCCLLLFLFVCFCVFCVCLVFVVFLLFFVVCVLVCVVFCVVLCFFVCFSCFAIVCVSLFVVSENSHTSSRSTLVQHVQVAIFRGTTRVPHFLGVQLSM